MRKLLGWLVFVLGVLGLTWWANGHQAKTIEAEVSESANAKLAALSDASELTVTTNGRDITVDGTVLQSDAEALKMSLHEAEGRRVVRMNIEEAEKFGPAFKAQFVKNEGMTFEGMTTSDMDTASVAKLMGVQNIEGNLEPSALGKFGSAGGKLTALEPMLSNNFNSANIEVDGETVTFSGEVNHDVDAAALTGDLTQAFGEGSSINITKLPAPVIIEEPVALDVPVIEPEAVTEPEIAIELDTLDVPNIDIEPVVVEEPVILTEVEALDVPVINPEVKVTENVTATGGSEGQVEETVEAPEVKTVEVEIEAVEAPAPEEDPSLSLAACQAGTDAVFAENKINFVSGSATLNEDSRDVVAQLAALIGKCLANSNLSLELAGHTDSSGDPASNLALSQERANAVVGAIKALGISTENVTAKGYGDTLPIASNETDVGKLANRRTTIEWSTK